MRKLEQRLRNAWVAGRPRSENNSSITINRELQGAELRLFGNLIAVRDLSGTDLVLWTLAGWNTLTTRSRLTNIMDARPLRSNYRFVDPDAWYMQTASMVKVSPIAYTLSRIGWENLRNDRRRSLGLPPLDAEPVCLSNDDLALIDIGIY